MTVKQLRELLVDVPDDARVLMQGAGDPNVLDVWTEASGYCEWGPLCDEHGNILAEQPEKSESDFFLVAYGADIVIEDGK